MLNIVTEKMPSFVDIDGIPVTIDTDFRTWIQVQRLLESGLEQRTVHCGVIQLVYGNLANLPDSLLLLHADELIDAALRFCRATEIAYATKELKASKIRTFDWDIDAKRLVADFQREYSLDLTSANLEMHWWRFIALFEGLTANSRVMKAIEYRCATVPNKASPEERRRIRTLQKAYELPPRSTDEQIARDAAIWGDDE